jgi:hypothetical protein
MTNIRCKGNREIDLLAIDPKTLEKFHVESRVHTSYAHALRLEDLNYFSREKFNHQVVVGKIREIFGDSNYYKWLVVWNIQDVPPSAHHFARVVQLAKKKYGIEVFGLRGIIHELIENKATAGSRDDVLRIMELVSLVRHEEKAFSSLKELEKETEELVQKVVRKERRKRQQIEKEREDKT